MIITKHKYTILDTIKTIVYAIIIAVLLRSLTFDPYHIPSASMRPTLIEGDKIIVNKLIYGYSRFSFPFHFLPIKGRLAKVSLPKRGDIVVFSLPSDNNIYYVKRIIGLPGDKIQIINGIVIVNDTPLGQAHNENNDTFTEISNASKSYMINISDRSSDAHNTNVYHVPKDHYFMMGDNRNNSIDSRFLAEVGMIKSEYLIGKVVLIIFSSSYPIYKPIQFLKNIQWNRIISVPS